MKLRSVAVAAKDMTASKKLFEEILGRSMEYEEHHGNRDVKLAMYPIGEPCIELLEGGPASRTAKWVSDRGEGLFHICLEVEDLRDALDELKRKGIKLLDDEPRPGHGGCLIASSIRRPRRTFWSSLSRPPRIDEHDLARARRSDELAEKPAVNGVSSRTPALAREASRSGAI